MGVKTPVPPPTYTRSFGLPIPPVPSRRYSPFMCIPSNASGAEPDTTDWMSFSSSPAESRAILVASNESSFGLSSIRRRNSVMPAPTIATRFFIDRFLLVSQHRYGSGGGWYSSPALNYRLLHLREL